MDGLATDAAVARLPREFLDTLRVNMSTSDPATGCAATHGHRSPTIVAIAPEDRAAGDRVASVVATLAPGHAAVDGGLSDLLGGTLVEPGVDVRIDSVVRIGTAVLLITMADLARMVAAHAGPAPLEITTVAILRGVHVSAASDGPWRTWLVDTPSVPLVAAQHAEAYAA